MMLEVLDSLLKQSTIFSEMADAEIAMAAQERRGHV